MIDCHGRTLTPCRRKVAEREVRLNRAKWIGPQRIRLRFDPFAYRYVRLKVLARDGYTCYWCGEPGFTLDHIVPWSKGGRTTMENCICACQECNGERGDMSAEEFARMRNVPPPNPARLEQRTVKQLAAARGAVLTVPQVVPVEGTGPAKATEAKKRAKQEPKHPAQGQGRSKMEQKAAAPAKQEGRGKVEAQAAAPAMLQGRGKVEAQATAPAMQQDHGKAAAQAAAPAMQQGHAKPKRRNFTPEAALALRYLLDPYGPRVSCRNLV